MLKFSLVLLISVGIALLIAIPAFSANDKISTDTVGTVGASAGTSVLLNQVIEWKKDQESKKNGFSPDKIETKLENVDERLKLLQRRVKHLETTMTAAFPGKFRPKDTI